MTTDPAFRMLPPDDPGASRRAERLRELGISGTEPVPEFDDFARQLAQAADAKFAMVNIIGPQQQYFAGLYPSSADRGVDWQTDAFRSMACDHGYCMHVLARGHALALPEVTGIARYAVNPVVTEPGVRAYLGAPLTDRDGTILGTICVLDTAPHPGWDKDAVEWIKAQARELTARILRREADTRPGG